MENVFGSLRSQAKGTVKTSLSQAGGKVKMLHFVSVCSVFLFRSICCLCFCFLLWFFCLFVRSFDCCCLVCFFVCLFVVVVWFFVVVVFFGGLCFAFFVCFFVVCFCKRTGEIVPLEIQNRILPPRETY